MSWGERSCKHFGGCTHHPTVSTCNPGCPHYNNNGFEPDTKIIDSLDLEALQKHVTKVLEETVKKGKLTSERRKELRKKRRKRK